MNARPEETIQKTLVQHLRCRAAPGVVWFAVPNEGERGGAHAARIGAIRKAMGRRAGVPDLLLVMPPVGRLHALELKAPKGRRTDCQKSTQADLEAAGATVATAYGLDDALAILAAWGVITGGHA